MTPAALSLTLMVMLGAAEPVPASAPTPASVKALSWNPKIDIPIAAVFGVGWLASDFVIKRPFAPKTCHWCETNGFDNSIRRIFNPTLESSLFGRPAPDITSSVLGFAVLPLAMIALDGWMAWEHGAFSEAWPADVVIMLEATFSAMVVNQTVKLTAGRARPYSIGADPTFLATSADPAENNVSFFSGHTTFAVGLAVSAGVVATMRGYKHAWVTWVVGIPLALTTAILRLAADKHWASDVLVGMAVGTAFGIVMPMVFHGPAGVTAQISASPSGASISGRF